MVSKRNQKTDARESLAKFALVGLIWLVLVGVVVGVGNSILGFVVSATIACLFVVAAVYKPVRDRIPLRYSASLASIFVVGAVVIGTNQYEEFQRDRQERAQTDRYRRLLDEATDFREQGQPMKAIAKFEAAADIQVPGVQEARSFVDLYAQQAVTAWQEGDHSRAKELVRRAMKHRPGQQVSIGDTSITVRDLSAQIEGLMEIHAAANSDEKGRTVNAYRTYEKGLKTFPVGGTVALGPDAARKVEQARVRREEMIPSVAATMLDWARERVRKSEYRDAIEFAKQAKSLYEEAGIEDLSSDAEKVARSAKEAILAEDKAAKEARWAAKEGSWAEDKKSGVWMACQDAIRRKLSPAEPDFDNRRGAHETIYEGDRLFRVHVKYNLGDLPREHFGKCVLKVDEAGEQADLVDLVTY